MRIFRILLSMVLVVYMTTAGHWALAQDADSSPFSITLAPVQYADVKGNVGKFEALNWMPSGGVTGVSDVSFVKDINKNIFLSVEGSEYSNDDGSGQLTLKDGDLAFLKIDYKAFRKYFDGDGGIYPYSISSTSVSRGVTTVTNYGTIPTKDQGVSPNSPDLQMDISYFKLEAGLGSVSDPFVDVAYEHNSKDGDKSLEQWAPDYAGSAYRKIAPAWESVNDTVDTITIKENKEFLGFTIKGDQKAEIDYNHNMTYMQYLNDTTTVPNQLNTLNDSPDAKLFGSGVRAERWMFNDNTFAGLGYHYNHTHDTDTMQQTEYKSAALGTVTPTIVAGSNSNGWNVAHASEDEHVWIANFNSNLTPNLAFLTDVKYEHVGGEGASNYYGNASSMASNFSDIENHQDNAGEHVALRYYGLSHTSLYAEGEFENDRNWVSDYESAISAGGVSSNIAILERLDRTESDAWTVGGRIVPNRFFTFTTQLKDNNRVDNYDTIVSSGSPGVVLLNYLRVKGPEEDSTLTWRPYHWLQNSLKYQFSDNVYNVQAAPSSTTSYPVNENHMLTSEFTYEITVQPVDPLLLMLSYSHVENYVRTITASGAGEANGLTTGAPYIPAFNSGDNSWLFSASYAPTDNLVWTNTVCYTLSPDYVNFSNGIPLGTDYRELDLTTGLDWTYHKWLTVGPKYEHASYKDNSLTGDGNYSANIFMLVAKFKW